MVRRNDIIICFLLFIAVLVCYSSAIYGNFIWDDNALIVNNPMIRAPLWSLERFRQDILNSSFSYSIYYRPIQVFSYALDYRVAGMNPMYFHFINVLIHFFNGVLLYFFLKKLFKKETIAFLSALIFIAHPINEGCVAYISGRSDLLYFFFGFLSLISYIELVRKKEKIFLVFNVLFLSLALLSKEAAVIFPVIMLLSGAVILKEGFRRGAKYLIPSFATVLVYMALHEFVFGAKYANVFNLDMMYMFLLRYFEIIKSFFVNAIYPFDLFMRRPLFIGRGSLYVLVVILFCFLLIRRAREGKRVKTFAYGFFLAASLPFVFAVGEIGLMAEHWGYLPCVGLFLFLACFLEELLAGRLFARTLGVGLILAIVITLATVSRANNLFWSSTELLSGRVLSYSEQDDAAMYFNVLKEREESGFREAMSKMDEYVSTRPGDLSAVYLRGMWKIISGKMDEAERDFKKIIEKDNAAAEGYFGLSMLECRRGNEKLALKYLEATVEKSPKHQKALLLLGTLYSKTGREEDALRMAKRAEKVNPFEYDTLINLGAEFVKSGDVQTGAKYFLIASELYPEKALAYYNLAYLFYSNGDLQESEEWIKKAIFADPSLKAALDLYAEIRGKK